MTDTKDNTIRQILEQQRRAHRTLAGIPTLDEAEAAINAHIAKSYVPRSEIERIIGEDADGAYEFTRKNKPVRYIRNELRAEQRARAGLTKEDAA